MTAADRYPWLAGYVGSDSYIGDDAAKALAEIDRLEQEVAELKEWIERSKWGASMEAAAKRIRGER